MPNTIDISNFSSRGTGTATVVPALQANTSRSVKQVSSFIVIPSEYEDTDYDELSDNLSTNKLIITQQAAPLGIRISGDAEKPVTILPEGQTTETVFFSGFANGRYLSCSANIPIIFYEYSDGTNHRILQDNGSVIGNTEVSQFGDEYEFRFSVSGSTVYEYGSGTYTITVSTRDTEDAEPVSVTYTLTAQASGGGGGDDPQPEPEPGIALSSVSISLSNDGAPIENGNTIRATLVPNPANADIDISSITWSAGNDKITIYPNGMYCDITATSQGGSSINVSAKDTNAGSTAKTAMAGLTIYNRGTITLYDVDSGNVSDSSITILSMSTSAQAGVVLSNIDTNEPITISVGSDPEQESWVHTGSWSLNTSQIPNTVTIGMIEPNNGTPGGRTEIVRLTGTDLLGNTVESNYLTIFQEYRSTIACTGMVISGANSINNANNYSDYTLTYYPQPDVTQEDCRWELNDSLGDPVSSSIAYLSNISDFGVTVNVGGSADNNTVYLKAVHQINGVDNNSVTPATQIITVSYSITGTVVITGVTNSSVDLAYYDTSNNAPTVTFTQALPAASTPLQWDNTVVTYAELQATSTSGVYKLVTTIAPNDSVGSSPRQGWVDIYAYDSNNVPMEAVRVQYNQAAYVAPANDFEFITTSGNVPKVERTLNDYTLTCKIRWINNASTSVTFTDPQYTLALYQYASDANPAFSTNGSFSAVTVGANTPLEVTHTDTLSNAMDASEYERIVMTVSTSSLPGVTKTYDSSL